MTRLLLTQKTLSGVALLLTCVTAWSASKQIAVEVEFVESGTSIGQDEQTNTLHFNSRTPASAQLSIESRGREIVLHYPIVHNNKIHNSRIEDLGSNAESITLTYY
ncbi:hypothetical protein R50073_34480 [Maricurvus nonylphenolicus]|uniref:hypothetical protein n=1 Tax=Maricurvus nonylphenolicus TaxID=1008307 RepID=UPI0036F2C4BE